MTALKKIRVLYLDDEDDNLLSFKAGFRRDYEIFTANSGSAGLLILNETPVDVIIADQRMPQSSGVDFFDIVRIAHPDPMRILLTGYTDIECVIAAINRGQIFRYIKKPWDELEIRTTIANAYEVYCTRMQLKNKIRELERTNDELNRFVYSTSHDLRSPLASVMGVLNLARMEGSVTDPNGYMGMIETCVKKMDFFIIKVIEYYKSVRVEETFQNVDLRTTAQESIDLCRLQNTAIDFNLTVQQPCEFRSDNFRLSVILNNLVSNAVKYQKPDEVHPYVNININVNEHEARISIEDNGVGIIENHLNNIFNMFFRSNFTVTGLGIGLYIVKEALSKIGGSITVNSSHGVGTSFKLVIPNNNKIKSLDY